MWFYYKNYYYDGTNCYQLVRDITYNHNIHTWEKVAFPWEYFDYFRPNKVYRIAQELTELYLASFPADGYFLQRATPGHAEYGVWSSLNGYI